MIKYDQLRSYLPDCPTGELQPHTSEIKTHLEKNSLPTGAVLKLLIMLLPLLRYLLTFCRRSSLSDYLRLLHITGYLQLEVTDSTKKTDIPGTAPHSTQYEPRERLLQKISLTMFELIGSNENIDVFKKNLNRATTDLVESIVFRRQRIAFSEDKISHFPILDLHHEPMDNSNCISFSMRPQKLKINPTYPSVSGCGDQKIAPDLPGARLTSFGRICKISTMSSTKKLFRTAKSGGGIF